MPFLAAAIPAIIGGLGAAGSAVVGALPTIAGAIGPVLNTVGKVVGAAAPAITGFTGANASVNAANAKVNAGNSAIEDWNNAMAAQRGNMAPFLGLGQTSASQLMDLIKNGTIGPGSLGPVPTAPGAFTETFNAPTAEEARQTPGYQFTKEQGESGILKAAAAAGGAINQGTFRALNQYDTGLADSTYNDVFNRAMQTYQGHLQNYQANLAGYGQQLAGFQTGMAAQQQGFNQLFAPAQLGTQAATSLNANINSGAIGIADLMQWIGNSQAAGILGKDAGMSTGLSGLPGLLSKLGGLMSGSGDGGFMNYDDAKPFTMPGWPTIPPVQIPEPPSGVPNTPSIPGMPSVVGNGLPAPG